MFNGDLPQQTSETSTGKRSFYKWHYIYSTNLPNYSKWVGTVCGNLRDTKDNEKD